MTFDLEQSEDKSKLALAKHVIASYLASRNALKEMGILRSERQLQGDYSEWIVASFLNLKLCESAVEKGIDAIDEKTGETYQVKSRIIKRGNTDLRSTSFDIKNINDHFDYLVGVFLEAETFEVIGLVKIPYEVVKANGNQTSSTFRYRWNDAARADDKVERLFWREL